MNGLFEAGVQPGSIPHRPVAGGQRLLQDGCGAHMRRTLRLIQAPARGEAVAMRGQVVVPVD